MVNYYSLAMELLSDHARSVSYDGDDDGYDSVLTALLDRADGIASTLFAFGVTWDYAFWLSARRIVGSL